MNPADTLTSAKIRQGIPGDGRARMTNLYAEIISPGESDRFQSPSDMIEIRLFIHALSVLQKHWRQGIATALVRDGSNGLLSDPRKGISQNEPPVATATELCKPRRVADGRGLGRRTEIIVMATVAGASAAAIAAGGLRLTKLQVSDAATTPGTVVVVTAAGAVRGKVTAGMRSFLGVPYAAPPVGALRWRPPRPHATWEGTRNANAFGSPCPQEASLLGPPSTNEDCLFLNVFTPASAGSSSSGLPVMVWIHGGGYVSGDASSFLPNRLVARGVVVVTVNYRLGVLGFLAHRSFAAESRDHASGDYGLMDQQLALRWVRLNAARFGGDPGNVTVFGESSGGESVNVQLASPTARGLFQRAIVESGGYSDSQPTLATAEATGASFAARIGCPSQSAPCMRGVSVRTLLANEPYFEATPVVDGRLLTRPVTDAIARGLFNRVPVIEGSNHDEFRLFLALNELAGSKPVSMTGYRSTIAGQLDVDPTTADTIAAEYPLRSYGSPSLALSAAVTDAAYACKARDAVQALSKYVPAYQYEFADKASPRFFPGPPVSFPLGAFHSAELEYLFTLPSYPVHLDRGQKALSMALVELWTSFAKTGDPGSGWPRYSAATDEAESLAGPKPASETNFAAVHHCDFWTRHQQVAP
jgi:para-nitrobenzyl esterase